MNRYHLAILTHSANVFMTEKVEADHLSISSAGCYTFYNDRKSGQEHGGNNIAYYPIQSTIIRKIEYNIESDDKN